MKKPVLSRKPTKKATQVLARTVIAHAAWKRSRGRNPSMPFMDERNPRKALKRAELFLHNAYKKRVFKEVVTATIVRSTRKTASPLMKF